MEDTLRDNSLEAREQIARLMTFRCANCYNSLPGYNVKKWNWLTENVGPFCDSCFEEINTKWTKK